MDQNAPSQTMASSSTQPQNSQPVIPQTSFDTSTPPDKKKLFIIIGGIGVLILVIVFGIFAALPSISTHRYIKKTEPAVTSTYKLSTNVNNLLNTLQRYDQQQTDIETENNQLIQAFDTKTASGAAVAGVTLAQVTLDEYKNKSQEALKRSQELQSEASALQKQVAGGTLTNSEIQTTSQSYATLVQNYGTEATSFLTYVGVLNDVATGLETISVSMNVVAESEDLDLLQQKLQDYQSDIDTLQAKLNGAQVPPDAQAVHDEYENLLAAYKTFFQGLQQGIDANSAQQIYSATNAFITEVSEVFKRSIDANNDYWRKSNFSDDYKKIQDTKKKLDQQIKDFQKQPHARLLNSV